MKKYDKKLKRREWFINKIMPAIALGVEKYSIDLNSDGLGKLGEFGKVEKLNDSEREEFINGEINDLKESLDDWLKGICEMDYVRAEKSTQAILYVEIKNPKELYWRAGEVYDENIEEPYGKERQKIELLKDIKEKYKKLGNKTMFLKIGLGNYYLDAIYDIDNHLKLFEALKELEKEGLAKTEDNFLKANLAKIEGITITIADKLIKTLNEEKEDKAKNTPKIKLPKGAKWEDLEIKFKNNFLDIEVRHKKKYIDTFTNENLGFIKTNTNPKKPDKQWEFLKELSFYSAGKNWPTKENIAHNLKITSDNCMKIKEKLSDKLQKIFGIESEPFKAYKEKVCYQPEFILKPTSEIRGDGEIKKYAGNYNDDLLNEENKEYLTDFEKEDEEENESD